MKFTGKWMDLESIVLSKVTQNQKEKNHLPPCIGSLAYNGYMYTYKQL